MHICVEPTENGPDTSLHGDSRVIVCQQDRPKGQGQGKKKKNLILSRVLEQ